jgi:hypothetical protein
VAKRVVAAFSWSDSRDNRHQWAQVLELVDGKIICMQDFAKPSNAALLTRPRTALSTKRVPPTGSAGSRRPDRDLVKLAL